MKRQGGFSLVELMLVIGIILLLVVLLFPVLAAARRTANESSTVATLRSIAECEAAYSSRNAQRFAGNLANLSNAGYLDARFAGSTAINGYVYSNGNNVGAAIPSGVPLTSPDGYAYSAAPDSPNEGTYNFAVAADGTVYYGNNAPPGQTGQPVGH